ncbi:hypothetical protein JOL62DRAFT_209045 [Phyllosticta paracitricarpa]|uniref:Uncharacterized protein n=1 Tax=Phyllosticta paracitricarpa TaxID=2016321 RepID=A0ABR1N3D2_9PEZI
MHTIVRGGRWPCGTPAVASHPRHPIEEDFHSSNAASAVKHDENGPLRPRMGSLKGCWGRRPQGIFCGATAIGPPSRRNQADRRFSREGRSGWRAERQKDSRAQSDSNSGSIPADDGRMTLDWLAGWLDGWDRIRETGTVCGLCMQERIGATWRLLRIFYPIQLKCYCCHCHWYSAYAGDDISGRATQLLVLVQAEHGNCDTPTEPHPRSIHPSVCRDEDQKLSIHNAHFSPTVKRSVRRQQSRRCGIGDASCASMRTPYVRFCFTDWKLGL